MGVLGDLLEAMHDAPRARSLVGSARQGQHLERLREMLERGNAHGNSRSIMLTATSGPPGAAVPTGYHESQLQFWSSGDLWRVDRDGTRSIGSPEGVFRFRPPMGAFVTPLAQGQPIAFEGMGAYFSPFAVVGSWRFGAVDDAEHLRRSCWHVSATAEEAARRFGPASHLLGGGDQFELWVDQAVGIVLRCIGRFEGELVSSFEVDDLVVDAPVDDEVFAFVTPDGSPVRTQAEMQLEHLQRQGTDVSGIDPNDPDQVHEALMARAPGGARPPNLEQLAAQHLPTGPPPTDEESARAAIAEAYANMSERTDDGAGLVNVERGEDLGPCAAEVQRRFPRETSDGRGALHVEHVKFLNATEAVVWTSGPFVGREGRAVLVDGAWKVSRATYCALIALAGVVCPPPETTPGGQGETDR
jgi:hypothetical protein